MNYALWNQLVHSASKVYALTLSVLRLEIIRMSVVHSSETPVLTCIV